MMRATAGCSMHSQGDAELLKAIKNNNSGVSDMGSKKLPSRAMELFPWLSGWTIEIMSSAIMLAYGLVLFLPGEIISSTKNYSWLANFASEQAIATVAVVTASSQMIGLLSLNRRIRMFTSIAAVAWWWGLSASFAANAASNDGKLSTGLAVYTILAIFSSVAFCLIPWGKR